MGDKLRKCRKMRDECYFIIHEPRVSTIYTSKRAYTFDIKPCVEYFVLYVLCVARMINNYAYCNS